MKRYFYITPKDYETAKRNGISAKNVRQRVGMYGWNVDRAITEPVAPRKRRVSTLKLLEQNGIPYDTFCSRLSRGWSEDKAATVPPLHAQPRIIPEKHIQEAKRNGIPYPVLRRRVTCLKWPIEKAATIPPMSYKDRRRSWKVKDA